MNEGILRKGLVVGIIVLFIGISVIPSTASNLTVEKSSKTTIAPMDSPLPPLMWTEDFSTFYILIPGDPGGGYVCYHIDWGDGNTEETGWYESNETVALSHIWDEGEYTIEVKAKNQYGEESKWATYGLILSSDFKLFHISIGYVGINYIFTIYWKGCECYIMIDWGDGEPSDWIGPYEQPLLFSYAWSLPGEYILRFKLKDFWGNESDWITFIITILSLENNPPDAPIITGPTNGRTWVWYEYNFSISDPDGDSMHIRVDWEYGTPSKWDGPFPSGSTIKYNYSWMKRGTYTIRAQTQDSNGFESDWGELQVTMPRNKATYNSYLLRFLEQFPILQKIFIFLTI